ncbi:hypothetical protein HK096_010448, partial [Nowakowskiella sp. JEL0078]
MGKSISLLNKSIYLVPSEPSYYFNKAQIYLDCQDVSAAIANYQRAYQLATGLDLISELTEKRNSKAVLQCVSNEFLPYQSNKAKIRGR